MSGILASVDQRTRMVGQNRMELLMFKLVGSPQTYGINVFKVREVTQCPKLTAIPGAHDVIRGIADFRGNTIPVIDLSAAIGKQRVESLAKSLVIITEYNCVVQAFIVDGVDRIINLSWDAIRPPPPGASEKDGCYLTAVTEVDNKIIEIIDVEKVLAEVHTVQENVSEEYINILKDEGKLPAVMVVDDSAVARNQISRCLEQVGIESVTFNNGRAAYDFLVKKAESDGDINKEISMLISDVEMPVMDGYTLVRELKNHPKLKALYIIMHTSLSGVFDKPMVEKVGADRFISKFHPDLLAKEVKEILEIEFKKA